MFALQSDNIDILLSLGSNLGDRKGFIDSAYKLINQTGLINNCRLSSYYESEPVGFSDQPYFINACLRGTTKLPPNLLIYFAKSLEYLCGRVVRKRWHERELDIDIIMYGDSVLNLRHLILPHPRFHERKFVLMPSNEIAGEMINPVNGKSISLMLDECSDNSIVRIFENHLN